MKRRVGLWLALGAVLVLGGFALLAVQMHPDPRIRDYEAAVEFLQASYPSSNFWVSPFQDPRTRVERRSEDEVVVRLVMRSDHAEIARYAAESPTGEVRVRYEMYYYRQAGGLASGYVTAGYYFEPVK